MFEKHALILSYTINMKLAKLSLMWLFFNTPKLFPTSSCSSYNEACLYFVFCEHWLCTSVISCSSNSSFMLGTVLLILFHQPLSVVCLTVDIKHSYYVFNWISGVLLRDVGKCFSSKMKHSLNLCCVLSATPILISWSVVCPQKFPGPNLFYFSFCSSGASKKKEKKKD